MRKDKMSHVLVIPVGVLFLAVSLLLGWSPETAAQTPNYKGKVITIMTENSPGAGSDIMARLFTRHLPKYYPGNPKFIVRNMTGAAGIQCPNYIYNKVKKNGLTFITGSLMSVSNNIFRPAGVKYRLENMPLILGYNAGNVVYMRTEVAKTHKDLMNAKGLIFGHAAPAGSSSALTFIFTKELVGFPVEKFVWGYTPSRARLAVIKGEITSTAESVVGYRAGVASYVKKGEIAPIFQSGMLNAKGEPVRDPMAPDIPNISEFYKEVHGKMPSGPLWEACKAILIGGRAFGKYVAYPPKTPKNIVDMSTKAFRQMLKDPAFKKEAARIAPGDFFLGEDAPGLWESVVAPSADVLNYTKKMFTEKYGVKWD